MSSSMQWNAYVSWANGNPMKDVTREMMVAPKSNGSTD